MQTGDWGALEGHLGCLRAYFLVTFTLRSSRCKVASRVQGRCCDYVLCCCFTVVVKADYMRCLGPQDQKKAQKAIRASMKLLIERLSGRPSTTGRTVTPLPALESRCATPPSLLGPPLRPHVNRPSTLASLEGQRGLELQETGEATKAKWDEAAEGRDRRDSTGSIRTVLDGPESGQTTPASAKENKQDADIGMVLANDDRLNLRRVFPLSNDRAGVRETSDIKRLEEERELPQGASSSGDTDEWTVVERPTGSDEEPRTQPCASTSGRIIESFLNLNEGEVRLRGGPVRALDFRSLDRSEPYTELIHLLYVYPLSLHTAKKKNLLVKVELRDDDSHPDNPAMKVRPSCRSTRLGSAFCSADSGRNLVNGVSLRKSGIQQQLPHARPLCEEVVFNGRSIITPVLDEAIARKVPFQPTLFPAITCGAHRGSTGEGAD
jgi:hypothetical protein